MSFQGRNVFNKRISFGGAYFLLGVICFQFLLITFVHIVLSITKTKLTTFKEFQFLNTSWFLKLETRTNICISSIFRNLLKQILFVILVESQHVIWMNCRWWDYQSKGISQDEEFPRVCNKIGYFLLNWLLQRTIFMG